MSEVGIATHHGISAHRIHAMVLRYWYLLMSSWPRLLELVYWPALQIITWGFLQNYISQNDGFFARAGGSLIGAASSAFRSRFSRRCGRATSAT
jgi:ABC-2 type transport system permease protein